MYDVKDVPVGKNAPSVCRRMKNWIRDAYAKDKRYSLCMEGIVDKEQFVTEVVRLARYTMCMSWYYEAVQLQALMCLKYPRHIMLWFFRTYGYILWTAEYYVHIRETQRKYEKEGKVSWRDSRTLR